VNPQAEDGHIDIANEIAEALMRTNFSAYQIRILWAIWRKTYGWHKKNDLISVSQVSKMTQLNHGHVSRALKELELRNIIVRTPSGTRHGSSVGFQKNFEKWKLVPYGVYRTPSGFTRTPWGTKLVPHGERTKEKKETIQKKEDIRTAKRILEGYPRIISEDLTLRSIISWLKKGVDPADLIAARDFYRTEVEGSDTPTRFIFKSTNFFGRNAEWRNYVNPEIGEDEKSLRDFREYQKEIRAEKGSPGGSTNKAPRPD